MQIILLERVPKLGQMGEVVNVKPGYARNFLIPHGQGAAGDQGVDRRLRAAPRPARGAQPGAQAGRAGDGRQGRRPERHHPAPGQRDQPALRLGQRAATSPRRSPRPGITLDRQQIRLDQPLKTLGLHDVTVALHPEVEVTVKVNIARSQAEADIQAGKAAACRGAGGRGRARADPRGRAGRPDLSAVRTCSEAVRRCSIWRLFRGGCRR